MPGYSNRGNYGGGNRGGYSNNRGGGNSNRGRNRGGNNERPDLRGTLWGNNFRKEGGNEPALQGFVTVGGDEYRIVAFVNTSGQFREDEEAQGNASYIANELSGMMIDAFESDGIQLGLLLQPREEYEAARAGNSRRRGGRGGNRGEGNRPMPRNNRQRNDDDNQEEDGDIPFDDDTQEDDARPIGQRQPRQTAPAKGAKNKPAAKPAGKRGAKK